VARGVCGMPDSFGSRLRQQREGQQIDLDTIANRTKIKLSLLEELERDDVSHWPGGIFRRSFIRSYAMAVGLEPDDVVREFTELYPDPFDVAPAASDIPDAGASRVSPRPPMRLRYLVGTALSSLSRLRLDLAHPRPSPSDAAFPGNHSPVAAPAPAEPGLSAAADLCAQLSRVEDTREAAPILEGAAHILGAVGLVVWVWDPQTIELKPALAHGYSDRVLARLPRVRRDSDNATAAAFRTAQTCVVKSSQAVNGALVVPLMTAVGCVGALAVELQHGSERKESVRALATVFAAQLAGFVGTPRFSEISSRRPA